MADIYKWTLTENGHRLGFGLKLFANEQEAAADGERFLVHFSNGDFARYLRFRAQLTDTAS